LNPLSTATVSLIHTFPGGSCGVFAGGFVHRTGL